VSVRARVARVHRRLPRLLSTWTKASWIGVATLVGAALASPGGLARQGEVDAVLLVVGGTALLSLVLLVTSYVLQMVRRGVDATVEVTPESLVLRREGGAARVVPRAAIRSAYAVLARHGVGRVVVEEAEDGLEIEVATMADAEALATALGFAPGSSRVTVDLASRFRRFLHLVLGYFTYQFGATLVLFPLMLGLPLLPEPMRGLVGGPVGTLLVVLLYELLKRLAVAPVVTVGPDAIVVRGLRTRTIRTRDIDAVEQLTPVAPIHVRHGGKTTTIRGLVCDEAKRGAIARHLHAALAARRTSSPSRLAALDRGGRSVRDWREHLRGVLSGTGYRDAGGATSVDEVVGSLASPAASAEQRIGAALALRVAGDPDAETRIRVAAEACVDERLRDALSAVADEADDEVLEKRLARLR
jgi:hypothetical protein